MQTYIGTKVISARPMTRAVYNQYRGWELPADENGDDDGFLVEYRDGGQSNHQDHDGYISWSPRDVFEESYQSIDGGMNFGHALIALKEGQKVARAGWNGKGMWLILVHTNIADAVAIQYEALGAAPWIGMRTADEKFVPWLASQTDVLSDDWSIIP